MHDKFLPDFNYKLYKWYNFHKRELPWRETKDPYLIWISEIILQQTRVVQGYEYYIRFIKAFPNVSVLANADENEVLKQWQGLGYYSRARNIHATAKVIDNVYGGVFPTTYENVIALKGIGEYTAAAITSFAYNLPYAVVDGNVFRFLSRLFAINTPIDTTQGKKEFTILANELLDKQSPDLHNQAVMEFGALQCTPSSPKCNDCCFNEMCCAYNEDAVMNYPVKQGKIITKDRFFNYIDIRFDDFMFLHKRTENDIWKGLYELPLVETKHQVDFMELQQEEVFQSMFENANNISIENKTFSLKHVLSHQKIYANFYQISISNDLVLSEKFQKIKINTLDNYPVSRLVDKYLTNSQV